jgi:hypothetical protein
MEFQESQPEVQDLDEDLYDAQEMNVDETSSNEDVLLFQLTRIQQQLESVTEERNALRTKNLASFKRSAVLSREKGAAVRENSLLRKQRNILQARLDALEDQGIDIGKPRNDQEAEVRVARRKQREQMRSRGGLVGAKIFPAKETELDVSQDVSYETELLNATDEAQSHSPEPLLSPKELKNIDMLFDDESDEAPAEGPEMLDENGNFKLHTPAPQHFVFNGFADEGMVYENSEDLIDWTPDDEYQFDSNAPDSVHASGPSAFPTQASVAEAPLASQYCHTLSTAPERDEEIDPIQAADIVDKKQRDEALAKLDQPWDDLARPLSPRSSPTSFLYQECETKLAILQTSLNQTIGELEQSRRDLATRTGERNGARQRIAVLEDDIEEREAKEIKLREEIAVREAKEVQLREELRLEREEDPLSDKLFVELAELRKQFEESEEKVEFLTERVLEGDIKCEEESAKVTALEEAAEQGNAVVESLQLQIENGNAELVSLTEALHMSRAETQRLEAELQAAKRDLETAKEEASAKTTTALNTKEQDTLHFTSQASIWRQEVERTQLELSSCQASLQKTTASLDVAEANIKELSSQLQQAKSDLERARNESRNAVAAAEKSRDEAIEGKRALSAANDMGHRLRRLASENVRELVMIREQRDEALQDVSRLTRDLHLAEDELRKLKGELKETTAARDAVVNNLEDMARRYNAAKQAAEDYLTDVENCREEVEQLRTQMQDRYLPPHVEVEMLDADEEPAESPTAPEEPHPTIPGPASHTPGAGDMADDTPPHSPVADEEEKAPSATPASPAPPPPPTPPPPSPKRPRSTRNPNPLHDGPPTPTIPTPSRKKRKVEKKMKVKFADEVEGQKEKKKEEKEGKEGKKVEKKEKKKKKKK